MNTLAVFVGALCLLLLLDVFIWPGPTPRR